MPTEIVAVLARSEKGPLGPIRFTVESLQRIAAQNPKHLSIVEKADAWELVYLGPIPVAQEKIVSN